MRRRESRKTGCLIVRQWTYQSIAARSTSNWPSVFWPALGTAAWYPVIPFPPSGSSQLDIA